MWYKQNYSRIKCERIKVNQYYTTQEKKAEMSYGGCHSRLYGKRSNFMSPPEPFLSKEKPSCLGTDSSCSLVRLRGNTQTHTQYIL